jgi:nicotinamide mononucleotide adenylyltransferase
MKTSTTINETGVIHGRFQVLHNDHLKYLLAGKKLCRHLVVGITNPDPFLTRDESADPARSSVLANPLTYYERYILVKTVLGEIGLNLHEFSVVPLPINLPERYKYYVPMDAVFFLTIYDDWGRRKLNYFQSLGLKTHVLWEVPPEKKGISGSDIRNRMLCSEPWEHMVPQSVSILMKKWNIPSRLRKIQEGL